MGLIGWVRYGSNNFGENGGTNDDKGKDCNYLGSGDYSPEKAALYRSIHHVPGSAPNQFRPKCGTFSNGASMPGHHGSSI